MRVPQKIVVGLRTRAHGRAKWNWTAVIQHANLFSYESNGKPFMPVMCLLLKFQSIMWGSRVTEVRVGGGGQDWSVINGRSLVTLSLCR